MRDEFALQGEERFVFEPELDPEAPPVALGNQATGASRSDIVRAVRERLATLSLNPGLQRALRRPMSGELSWWNPTPLAVARTPRKQPQQLLTFKIPESPYTDDLFSKISKGLDIFGAIDTGLAVFGVEIAGLLGMSLTVIAPFAGFVANMFAIGSGYAEARAKIARERLRIGFALGVIAGSAGRSWKSAQGLLWKWTPEVNSFDQDAGKIAQNAFNLGVVSGFVQGSKLSKKQRDFLMRSLGRTLTEGDINIFSGDRTAWSQRTWYSWYVTLAASFLKLYVKD